MYEKLLLELKNKFNYSNELIGAIELIIPLLIDTYGDDSIEEILNFFRNTRIFVTNDMSLKNRKSIENEMVGKKYDDLYDPYKNDVDPGAYYSYESICNDENDVVGEIRWIVANSRDGEKYTDVFGISLNVPYFLHEVNHAFAMKNPVYRREGDIIYSKHGMYNEVFEIKNDKLSISSSSDIILEEIINELYTQRQLTKLAGKKDYNEVNERLRKINHVSTVYNPVLIMLAEKFEELIGKNELLNYRKNNDISIKEEFNLLASKSPISNKYFPGINAWDYFSEKCSQIFDLSKNKIKYINSIELYGEEQLELMLESFAPLYAYREVKYGDTDISVYDEIVASNSKRSKNK